MGLHPICNQGHDHICCFTGAFPFYKNLYSWEYWYELYIYMKWLRVPTCHLFINTVRFIYGIAAKVIGVIASNIMNLFETMEGIVY